MRFEHNQITDLLGNIESATELDSARALAKQMIEVTRGHFDFDQCKRARKTRMVFLKQSRNVRVHPR